MEEETFDKETPSETVNEVVQEETAVDGPAPSSSLGSSLDSSQYVEMILSRILAFCKILFTVMCVKCMLY